MKITEIPCPICSSSRVRVCERYSRWRNIKPPYKISECLDCRMRFLSPRPSEDEYKNFYSVGGGNLSEEMDAKFYIQEEQKRKAEFIEILSQISKIYPANSSRQDVSIIDVGCSTGLFVKLANDMGYKCIGLEPNEKACSMARTLHHVKVINSTIENADLPNESFDVVHSHHALEHLYHPLLDLRTMTEWLKPTGLLIVEVPNEIRNVARLRRYTLFPVSKPYGIESFHHTSFFDRHSIRLLFSKVGLEKISVRAPYSVMFAFYKFPLQLVSLALSGVMGGGGSLITTGRRPSILS